MRKFYDEDGITIYHGDCRETLPFLDPPDAVITDPPYGSGFYETDIDAGAGWLRDTWSSCSALAVFGYPELLVQWVMRAELPPPVEWVTWWPSNGHCFGNPRLLPRESECVALWGELERARELRRPRSKKAGWAREQAVERGKEETTVRLGDVWRDPAPGKGFNHHLRLHPNQKPLAVMERLVHLCAPPGGTVLDPFMGSGTTLVAAQNLGRRAIGIEMEAEHCETAVGRLSQAPLALAA